MGAKRPVARTPNGDIIDAEFAVCDVHRPLLSVAKMVDGGHDVVFSSKGSYIHYSNGHKTALMRENNVFHIPVEVLPAKASNQESAPIGALDGYVEPSWANAYRQQSSTSSGPGGFLRQVTRP